MKKIVGLILIFSLSDAFGNSKLITQQDYKITIPENWIPISKENINELQSKNDPELRTYIVGFSKHDSSNMRLPYFIVNYNEIPGSENALFKDILKIQGDILKNNGLNYQFTVDSIHHKFYTEQDFGGIKVYEGYSVGYNGILYLNYYAEPSDTTAGKSQFLSILNSIDHNQKFLNMNYHQEEAKKYEKKAGEHATMALIALGMFGVVYFLRRLMKK